MKRLTLLFTLLLPLAGQLLTEGLFPVSQP
jgi:hypothetical protein